MNHLTRKTEDGHKVFPHQRVWEIMYCYINPEVSIPEPEAMEAIKVPLSQRIWFHEENCRNQCKAILSAQRKSYRDELLTYFNSPK